MFEVLGSYLPCGLSTPIPDAAIVRSAILLLPFVQLCFFHDRAALTVPPLYVGYLSTVDL